jgi:hypothetical protein
MRSTVLWALIAALSSASAQEFRVERTPVGTGAELLTVFGTVAEKGNATTSVPLVAVLRDTLGDQNPENDRLRYVWVLTSARPTILQHAAASIPFFYWQPDLGKNADRTPAPVLDLGAASQSVWTQLAGSLAQVAALDGNGAILRASTRRYQSNVLDHRRTHLIEGLTVLSEVENVPEVSALLSEPELLEIEARLTLAGQTLGGLVNAKKLPEAYRKHRTRTEEERGHNWELLRQRAEANGLYFEPLGMSEPTHALLWVAREDATAPGAESRRFDGRFLGISNPFGDSRIKNWSGYSVPRKVDGDTRTVNLIPLGLYALDYPKVPLLLADFRAARAAKRREMMSNAMTDTVTGVLGVAKYGNWPYMAGTWTWNFLRTRHGDPASRDARLRAYSGVRQWLALDHSLEPDLRIELQKRLEIMGVNPLEESVFSEARIATKQYDALLKYAADPHGLSAKLDKDRRKELTDFEHCMKARVGFTLAHVATLGIYTHSDKPALGLTAELDRNRRADRQLRFLENVAASSPQTSVVWNLDEVRRALDDLASTGLPGRSTKTLEKLRQQTSDEETKTLYDRALRGGGVSVAIDSPVLDAPKK